MPENHRPAATRVPFRVMLDVLAERLPQARQHLDDIRRIVDEIGIEPDALDIIFVASSRHLDGDGHRCAREAADFAKPPVLLRVADAPVEEPDSLKRLREAARRNGAGWFAVVADGPVLPGLPTY